MRIYLLFFFFIVLSEAILSQEELMPLKYEPSLIDNFIASKKSQAADRENIRVNNFVYRIDTLEMPFIDDFATNRIKKYNATTESSNVTLDVRTAFSVNNSTPDSLELVFFPTYNYILLLNGDQDSTVNSPLYLVYYDTSGIAINYDTAWPNTVATSNQTTGLVTFDTIVPETLLVNTFDTLYVVLDDATLWMSRTQNQGDRGAYINNNYATNAMTQGVATFDGTDATGFPYDIATATTYGLADELESKPINIDSSMSNIYLSFFYEAGGIGNTPDEEDSLAVDFYNVRDSKWERVWSAAGANQFDTLFSDQVVLPISGSKYQRKGFQFRFVNYSTLSGSYDHWHIDYVRLDKNIDTILIDTITDISYINGVKSYLNQYTSVPYRHYLFDPVSFQKVQNQVNVRNLGENPIFVDEIGCALHDEQGTELLAFSTAEDQFPAKTTVQYNISLPETQIFPDNNSDIARFTTTCALKLTAENLLLINDTIRSTQVLSDYYSYDDGTAENGYALSGAGLYLAYEFSTPIKDTLKAFYINLPQMEHDMNPDLAFKFKVWDEFNGEPIYEDVGFKTPVYTKGNTFYRYKLDDEVSVSGTFYIGYEQAEATKIYVGFDKNNDNSSKLFIPNDNDVWQQSKFKGSLMLRPDFGYEDVLYTEEITTNSSELFIYPNPASSQFKIGGVTENLSILIYSIKGSLLLNQNVSNNEIVNCSSLPAGIYIVEGRGSQSGKSYVARLAITK